MGSVFGEILQAVPSFKYPLDLRRLERIVVSNDFDQDFKKLSEETGRCLVYTQNELGACVAKVVSYREGDDFRMVIIVRSGLANVLLSEDEEQFKEAFHLIHHELCHVHDFNMKATALKDSFMKTQLSGVAACLMPMANTLWDEYFAVRTSASSAVSLQVADQVSLFGKALKDIPSTINKQILEYRLGGMVDELLEKVTPQSLFLLQIASYVRGYLDGGWDNTEDISNATREAMSDSFFAPVWDDMSRELRQMYASYPAWVDMKVYDGLLKIVEKYCDLLGWTYESIPEGVYVRVPMRPETNPLLVSEE